MANTTEPELGTAQPQLVIIIIIIHSTIPTASMVPISKKILEWEAEKKVVIMNDSSNKSTPKKRKQILVTVLEMDVIAPRRSGKSMRINKVAGQVTPLYQINMHQL